MFFLSALYHSHFSAQSGRAMKLSYLVMMVIVITYTVIVLLDGGIDTCSFAGNRLSEKEVAAASVKFLNPEFDVKGGCLRRRFWFLLWLTPEECMLCRRILLSVVLGMLIGFERRRADRPAGVRTMALVSLGSCIFTIDSMFAFSNSPDSWDSSRVAAAIPSGVGFLGAGLIYKRAPQHVNDRHEVHGLTTASSVWLSAAAGIAAGGGLAVIALFSTMVMIIVLRFGPRLPLDQGDHPTDDDDDVRRDDDDEAKRHHQQQPPGQQPGGQQPGGQPGQGHGDLERGPLREKKTNPLINLERHTPHHDTKSKANGPNKDDLDLPERRKQRTISFLASAANKDHDDLDIEEHRPLVHDPPSLASGAGYSSIDSPSTSATKPAPISRKPSLRE